MAESVQKCYICLHKEIKNFESDNSDLPRNRKSHNFSRIMREGSAFKTDSYVGYNLSLLPV